MTLIRPMLCRKVSSLDEIDTPSWLSPKLNGIRATWHPQFGLFQTKHGKFWPSWMTTLIWRHPDHYPTAYLDGEFLLPNLQDLGSAIGVNRHKPGPQAEDVTFNVFDVVAESSTAGERIAYLNNVVLPRLGISRTKIVQHGLVYDTEQVKAYALAHSHHEGIVSRPRDSRYLEGNKLVWKAYKFQTDEEVTIVSCHEAVGNLAGMLGGFTVRRGNDVFDVACSAFTHPQRQTFWIQQDSLIGKQLTIRYPYKSTTNVPLQAQCVAIRDYEQ